MSINVNKFNPWHYWLVNILLITTAITLGFGLFMPLITFKQLVFFTNTFSIVSGVKALYSQNQYLLFGIILVFSIVIPILKLVLLAINWNYPVISGPHWRARLLSLSAALGRWSMLDVFAVAVFVVMMKINLISEVQTHRGLLIFTFAVLALICLNAYINRMLLKIARQPDADATNTD
jgi:paraquat-inducible protein A